jgi:hypothetical protein
MDKWQRAFSGRLESVRIHWLERFEGIADVSIAPAFAEFDAFTTSRGFSVTTPACDSGARLCKFGLTENAYLLLWFRLHGFETIEAHAEVSVPGARPKGFQTARAHLNNVDTEWAREQFRAALDRFVEAFDEASRAHSARSKQQTEA